MKIEINNTPTAVVMQMEEYLRITEESKRQEKLGLKRNGHILKSGELLLSFMKANDIFDDFIEYGKDRGWLIEMREVPIAPKGTMKYLVMVEVKNLKDQ